jgi:hypothetical protein
VLLLLLLLASAVPVTAVPAGLAAVVPIAVHAAAPLAAAAAAFEYPCLSAVVKPASSGQCRMVHQFLAAAVAAEGRAAVAVVPAAASALLLAQPCKQKGHSSSAAAR